MWGRFWGVVVLASCGRVNFDPQGVGDSGAGDGDVTTCTLGPWGSVRRLTELGSPDIDQAPWISNDRREILFSSNRSGGAGMEDLYRATRASDTVPFGTPQLLELSTSAFEDSPYLSDDGLTIWFDRGAGSIQRSTRPDRTSPFPPSVQVAELSLPNGIAPSLTSDQLLLAMSADLTGDEDIGFARRSSTTATFGPLTLVTALSGTGRDMAPSISGDGRTILFQSDRFSAQMAIVESSGGPDAFAPPHLFAPAMTGAYSSHPYMSHDGRTALWAADTTGNLELYIVERECL